MCAHPHKGFHHQRDPEPLHLPTPPHLRIARALHIHKRKNYGYPPIYVTFIDEDEGKILSYKSGNFVYKAAGREKLYWNRKTKTDRHRL